MFQEIKHKIENSEINLDPFPHLIIRNLLPSAKLKELNKVLPNYIKTFPVKKDEITSAILAEKNNLKKIINIIHKEIRKKMKIFLKKIWQSIS